MATTRQQVPPSRVARAFVALLVLGGTAALALWRLGPPPVSVAEGQGFSVERALGHVRAMAREPHPVGSAANARVRAYLIQELERMGLEVQVQTGDGTTGLGPTAGALKNIVARLKGTGGGRALMLAAHYDSVPAGPGAADDAAAVAAILEAIRVVRQGQPLRNDLVVLITDAEEAGMVGARAFVAGHPWARDVDVVLNFEARGSNGPSLMFETGRENAWLVRQLAGAAPYPVAYSASYDVYRLMPNDTDFTVFRDRGRMPGLNFAFIGGVENYHRPTDDVGHLDVRSLAHHGSYALALLRRLGDADLTAGQGQGGAVWFSTLPPAMVVYSDLWVWPLAAGVAILWAGITAAGLRLGRLSAAGLLWGVAGSVASVLTAALLAEGLWLATPAWAAGWPGPMTALYSFAGLALAAVVGAWLLRRARAEELLLGAAAIGVGLTCATAAWLPGGSYLTAWPLTFALLAAGWRVLAARPARSSWGELAIFLAAALPAVLLVTPLVYLVAVALTLRLAAGFVAVAVTAGWLAVPVLGNLIGRGGPAA